MLLRRTLNSFAQHQPKLTKLPKLIIFDLDHTLWPFGVDTYCFTPPFHLDKSTGKLIDMAAQPIEYFAQMPKILQLCADIRVPVAVASRTKWPHAAAVLLELLKLKPYITYDEIYPGPKVKHFYRLRATTGAEFNEMIFFDDEPRNIVDVSALGVHSVLVDHDAGVSEGDVRKALEEFAQRNEAK